MVFMAETGNNRRSFNFTYISYYVFGNCLIDFPKIFIFGANCPFWVQNWCVTISPISLHLLSGFFWMLFNENGQEVDQNSVNGFLKIFLFAANGTFWTKNHMCHWICCPLLQLRWWKNQGSLKRILTKKSGEDYQEIIP